MRAFAVSALLALLVASPSLGASPALGDKQRQAPKPPSQLWEKYPLGEEKLAPLPKAEPTQRARPPAPAQTPPTFPQADRQGTSLPLWAVLLAALGLSCVLGLAGESLVARAKRLVRPVRTRTTFADAPAEEEGGGRTPPSLSSEPPAKRGGAVADSLVRLKAAAAALGYEDPRLRTVIDAVTVSAEWRPLALATALSSWDEPAVVPLPRPTGQLSPAEEGGRTMGGYDDLGNRVAAVLHAAEEVAGRIVEEAREEAADIRRKAEDAATSRVGHLTREAEQLHAKAERALAEAEAHARTKREDAETMATRIEADAVRHQDDLNAAARSLEERLRKTLGALERVSSNVEDVLGPSAEPTVPQDQKSASEALAAQGG